MIGLIFFSLKYSMSSKLPYRTAYKKGFHLLGELKLFSRCGKVSKNRFTSDVFPASTLWTRAYRSSRKLYSSRDALWCESSRSQWPALTTPSYLICFLDCSRPPRASFVKIERPKYIKSIPKSIHYLNQIWNMSAAYAKCSLNINILSLRAYNIVINLDRQTNNCHSLKNGSSQRKETAIFARENHRW